MVIRYTKLQNYSLAQGPLGVGGLMCPFLKAMHFSFNYEYGTSPINPYKRLLV
jgi:hypothetical protein